MMSWARWPFLTSLMETDLATPLDGLKVVELARILAGPWVGQTLADLGADVIKVEAPNGDDTRRWGPPFVEGEDGEPLDAAYFHSCNRGKRSITADFKTAEGQEIVRKLAMQSDVLIENFKVGGLKKFGLDYDALKEINPRLVYCSITGFGQNGPYAPRAGYDFLIQGMAGPMDLSGEPDGEPAKSGVPIADLFTALYAVIAIQAALHQREKTGKGQHLDLSLLDCMSGMLAYQAQNFFVSGDPPKRLGNGHPNIVPYQVFETANGPVIVATGNDGQYRRFCDVLGASELGEDPRFVTGALRVINREALIPMLQDRSRIMPRDVLLDGLEKAGVPAGPINAVPEVFADPQVIARGMEVPLPSTGAASKAISYVRTPICFSDADLKLERGAPRLGEHSDAILAEIGLSKGIVD